MTCRVTFTLEPEVFAFLKLMGGNNRSGYINDLLKREKQQALEKAIAAANREEANDPDCRDELEAWDTSLKDGLE